MADRVRELVESLSAQGFESPYLDRLRRRARSAGRGRDALQAIQREIVGEMAASLGRAEDRINEALLRLEIIGKELDAAGAPLDEERVREFNELREVAQRRVWELTVQREALGFRRNEILKKLYPIPPRR